MGPGNTIIFAAIGETGLSQMATSGGTIGPLTRLDPKRARSITVRPWSCAAAGP